MTRKASAPALRRTSHRLVTTVAAAIAAAALVGGCESANRAGDQANVGFPSPELQTLHQTPGQNAAKMRLYTDLGRRMFLEDLASWFHADRTTRLTGSPIPY